MDDGAKHYYHYWLLIILIIIEYYDYAVTTKRSRFVKNKFNNNLLPRVPVSKNDNFFKFFLKIKTPYEDVKFKE